MMKRKTKGIMLKGDRKDVKVATRMTKYKIRRNKRMRRMEGTHPRKKNGIIPHASVSEHAVGDLNDLGRGETILFGRRNNIVEYL